MRRLRKFSALTQRQKLFLLESFVFLGIASFALRFKNFVHPNSAASELDIQPEQGRIIADAAQMMDSAAGLGFRRNTCLEKSIALRWMLQRRKIPSTLQIGCATAEKFQGHAWLEINGIPINDAPDIRTRFSLFVPPATTPANASPSTKSEYASGSEREGSL